MSALSLRGSLGLAAGVLFLLAIFVAGLFLIPRYRAQSPHGLQRSDAGEVPVDGIYLDLTPVLPSMVERLNLDQYVDRADYEDKLPVLVGMNTHTGSIRELRINRKDLGGAHLIGPDGGEYPSIEEPLAVSEHHNTYLLFFPSKDHEGRRFARMGSGRLILRVDNVGEQPVRTFTWTLPLGQHRRAPVSATDWIMLAVAISGAMMVVLSPCAVELTLYYGSIVGAVLSRYGIEQSEGLAGAPDGAKSTLLRNFLAFTAGFTLLYAASGATVGLIGQGIQQPLGGYEDLFATVGGVLILFFALKVMGVFRLSGLDRIAGRISRSLQAWFLPENYRLEGGNEARIDHVNPPDSFLAGIGLSSGCLTCMGGAVLYPLLVYAGISSWYWGMLTLVLYSLLIAVPMMFIALGSAGWMGAFSRRRRLSRSLKHVSGLLLVGVSILLLSGQERWITDVFFTTVANLTRFVA